ncbi:MAG: SulP family inorganic anion transporter [Deltaproteobacteria bacterium]|nr:SulP family inorganic anion transporter [Deltaproteobacteria bacterium]
MTDISLSQRWRSDVLASLVVFLVALPLSLGIALASGAPIMSGVIAAAVGGIVVGLLAGAPMQASGPAAGLTVLVFGYVKEFGFAATCAVTVAAGLLQLAGGLGGLANFAMAISPSVIHGMLAGIGIVIALAQIHVVLGGAPNSSPVENLKELPAQLMSLHGTAALLGALTIAILIVWPLIPGKVAKLVPAPLVAVIVGTLAAIAIGADVQRVDLKGGLLDAIALPKLPDNYLRFAIAAVTMAIVASAESLLCAVATDKLHTGPRANLNKELVAQGAGNIVSGAIGGLPVTGVIVRSTANIMAGAKTRWSAVLHGVWVLIFVSALGFLIGQVPLAVLAGLLVYVGAKLVNPKHIRDLKKHRELLPYLATVAGIVGINLLAGIGIGFGVAIAALLYKLTNVKVKIERVGDRYDVVITGAFTFLGVPKVMSALAAIPSGAVVEIDLAVEIIDHGGMDFLQSWKGNHEKTGGRVDLDADGDAFKLKQSA